MERERWREGDGARERVCYIQKRERERGRKVGREINGEYATYRREGEREREDRE